MNNDKIFLTVIFNNSHSNNSYSNNYKKLINNINYQVYKNYYCLLIIKNKTLYDKINEYIKLLNLNFNIYLNNDYDNNIFINDNSYDSEPFVLMETENLKKSKYPNNDVSFAIHEFLKSDCNYFTWIYDNYVIDYFFLNNLIEIKSSFTYTSFKITNKYKNFENILLDTKYKTKEEFFIENNICFKSFILNKDTMQKICNNNNEFIFKKIEELKDYDFFYIIFKILDFDNIKYSNKILLDIILDNNYDDIDNFKNNIIYLDSEKNNIIQKYCTNNKIINNNILNLFTPKFKIDTINNNNNIIISLTSIPPRFLDIEFEDTIKSLFDQIIEPKYVILNLCNKYNRFPIFDNNLFYKKIDFLKNKYNKLIINITNDYGPITKILGLYTLKYNTEIDINISINDKLIIVDDDWNYKNTLTYYYILCYELYNCNAIFVNEKKLINWNEWWEKKEFNEVDNILHDSYQEFVFGWLSYSIQYKYINKLFEYYNYIVSINNDIINNDDLIISLFYKKFKLNACGLNLLLIKKKSSILDNIDPLRNINNSFVFKKKLEEKFLDIDNINNDLFDIFSINKKTFYGIKNIQFNNSNILDISYFNENILILTLYKNNLENEYLLTINNINYKIIINNEFFHKFSIFSENICKKNTYFIKIDSLLELEIEQ